MAHKSNKTGRCDVHFYINNDSDKKKVKWFPHCAFWVCEKCDDIVLMAMATIAKKQKSKLKNK